MLTTPKWKMTQLPICLCLKVTIFIDSEMLYFFYFAFCFDSESDHDDNMSLLSLPSVASTSSVTLTTESRDTTVMQPTLQTFLNRTKKFDINNPKAQAIHNAITRMICTESLPFNFVESDGFKHLINK
jgi:hypothetical protein